MMTLATQETAHPVDIFDEIRAGIRFVADRATHVRIREDRLNAYALSLQPRPPSNTLDTTHHFTAQDPEVLATYILCLEAVNFGSGYEDDLVREGWPRIDNSLYFTVSTALKKSFETDGAWTAKKISGMTVDDMHAVFMLPMERMGRMLATQFSESLNELGAFITKDYNESFKPLVESANGKASSLVAILGALPGFHDVVHYQGRDVQILKRAQIAASDLNLAFEQKGETLFSDIDRLTIFADNGLPHVLRLDGILELHPDLERRIKAGSFISAGSDEEVELRCCAAEAVERLAAIKGMRVVDIDHILWHRSVEDPKYLECAAHRTLTRFY